MNITGLPKDKVTLLEWDAHRVMRIAPADSEASMTDTRFDHRIGKWDVQIAEMEPANIDFLFNTIASHDVAKAARLYAIAHDMHADYQEKHKNNNALVGFDIDAVQIDSLEKVLKRLNTQTQRIILALHAEYVRRNNFVSVIPVSVVAQRFSQS
jgi:hypothetical protein